MIVQADAVRLPLADRSVDLVVGSPPYLDARAYGIGAHRNLAEWVAWMLNVTREAVRVSRGLVVWVCAGVTRDWCYQPGPEALLAESVANGLPTGIYLDGIEAREPVIAWRPCYWHRYGIPGSGGPQWYRADVEYALAFTALKGRLPHGEPTANGKPPRYGPGGIPTHRTKYDARRRQERDEIQAYRPPEIANPGCLLSTGAAGGGAMGHDLAHENEAPYPVAVPAFFINSHCPPGGLVLDPFGGSGTTAHAAKELGRRYITSDLRRSQAELARRRLNTVTPGFAFSEPSASGGAA